LPSTGVINEQRIGRFKQKITDTINAEDLSIFSKLVEEYQRDEDVDPLKMAAALARMAQGDQPLLISEMAAPKRSPRDEDGRGRERGDRNERGDRGRGRERDGRRGERGERAGKESKQFVAESAIPLKGHADVPMERFKVEVGYNHGVKPGNLVGAIANEADMDSEFIGHIEIYEDFSTIDLPAGMPKEVFGSLKKVWVCQQQLNIASLSKKGSGAPKKTTSKKRTSKEGAAKKSKG